METKEIVSTRSDNIVTSLSNVPFVLHSLFDGSSLIAIWIIYSRFARVHCMFEHSLRKLQFYRSWSHRLMTNNETFTFMLFSTLLRHLQTHPDVSFPAIFFTRYSSTDWQVDVRMFTPFCMDFRLHRLLIKTTQNRVWN